MWFSISNWVFEQLSSSGLHPTPHFGTSLARFRVSIWHALSYNSSCIIPLNKRLLYCDPWVDWILKGTESKKIVVHNSSRFLSNRTFPAKTLVLAFLLPCSFSVLLEMSEYHIRSSTYRSLIARKSINVSDLSKGFSPSPRSFTHLSGKRFPGERTYSLLSKLSQVNMELWPSSRSVSGALCYLLVLSKR